MRTNLSKNEYQRALNELDIARNDVENTISKIINKYNDAINLKNGRWRYIRWSFLPPLSLELAELVERVCTNDEPKWCDTDLEQCIIKFYISLSHADDLYYGMSKEDKAECTGPSY